jgi:cytochrome b pre-mRNA-processing protein 3
MAETMKLFAAFRRTTEAPAVEALYRSIVGQARNPAFYTACGVPDTPDGRYDVIVAHVVLVLRRLHETPTKTKGVSQALFDLMFADMDQNLREMGVGDLAVGKRIKAMAKAFYGRLAAYDAALSGNDDDALRSALRRNLYRKADPTDAQVAAVAAYLRTEAMRLDEQSLAKLLGGDVYFGPPRADTEDEQRQ